MVSPPKNVVSQQQNVEFCYLRKKNAESSAIRGSKDKSTRIKKPYAGKTIYLDLKSSKESTLFESSLKSLGANIAVFLDQTVTHVVTDRLDRNQSIASPVASVSPIPTPSPTTSERSSFPRSRGVAMLECVKYFPNTSYADPLHLANRWSIPILPSGALWRDIARFEVVRKLQKTEKKLKSPKVESHFIKIEPVSRNRKPDLLKLNKWPELNLDCPIGQSPFQWEDFGDGLRRRDHQPPVLVCCQTVLGFEPLGSHPHAGESITKLKSAMTRRLLKNSVSSEEDTACVSVSSKTSPLCNGHVPTRHSHDDLKVQCNGLSINHRSSKLLSPSGSDVLPLGSQRRATRRASASWCGSTRELAQLSPTDSDLGVSLRPKATLWLPASLVGTTAEEHGNTVRRRTTGDDARPKKKKLSPEEKLLQDNKEYFKMEVLNTKLRSSGSIVGINKEPPPQINKIILKKVKDKSTRNKWTKTKDIDFEDDIDYEALIVQNKIMKMNGVAKKAKRQRQSELMKLCDEAESFMFGESSRQRSASEDTSRDTSQDSLCSEEGKRRKRRSHAEVFIHDNIDYYKFETPGTRLRNQGSLCESDTKSDDINDVKKEVIEWRTVLFSFQTIPCTEPWFDVYTRQDDGKEMHFPIISDPANQPFLLPYELPRPVYVRPEPSDYYAKRKKRIAQIIAQSLPRKSPRCHASTLAILSSLKRRKRKSSNIEGESSKKREDDILGIHSDEEVEQLPLFDPGDPEPNRRRKKTDDRLALRSLDTEPVIETSRLSRPTMDVVDLIEAFREESKHASFIPEIERDVKTERGPRKRRKCRKFNKTGWDKAKVKKVKRAPRDTGIAQENVLTSPRRPRESPDHAAGDVTPCLVRVRKLPLRSEGESFCRRLVFTKRRQPVTDYSWTTSRR